jgi:hypothetical protein
MSSTKSYQIQYNTAGSTITSKRVIVLQALYNINHLLNEQITRIARKTYPREDRLNKNKIYDFQISGLKVLFSGKFNNNKINQS